MELIVHVIRDAFDICVVFILYAMFMEKRAEFITIINVRLNPSSPFDQKFVAAESFFVNVILSVQLMLRVTLAQMHYFRLTLYKICI